MNCDLWLEKLSDLADGTTAPGRDHALDRHLESCPACRDRLASLRALLVDARALPREIPVRDLWPEVKVGMRETGNEKREFEPRVVPIPNSVSRFTFYVSRLPTLLAASLALLAAVGLWTWQEHSAKTSWTVAAVEGTPRLGARPFSGEARFRQGQWIETDGTSRARVAVGTIGSVSIDPHSRVRLISTASTDHRLELARGTLHAVILAPPRLFFVETAAATAVDMGCAYTIAVDDSGRGILHVTSGYVSLEHGGRETLVRAGMMCATRTGAGPGTPFAADASPALQRALDRLDFEPATPAAVADVLRVARPREDALTLWHVLSRAAPPQRGAIFDVLASAIPPPDDVTRAGIVAGDSAMLDSWSAMLERVFAGPVQLKSKIFTIPPGR